MRLGSCILMVAAAAGLALPAMAQDYFPLDTGLVWNYTSEGTSELVSTSLGPVEYNGLIAVELQHVQTGYGAQEYHNYWTREDDGDTWLHGAWNADGFAATYDPPILYVDAPLFLGHVWTTEFGMNGTTYEITYEVVEAGETTVPLGVLYGYGISAVQPLPAMDAGNHDLLGRRRDAGREAGRWLSEGIGMIRTAWGLELASFSGTVAVETITWSGIRALFAD